MRYLHEKVKNYQFLGHRSLRKGQMVSLYVGLEPHTPYTSMEYGANTPVELNQFMYLIYKRNTRI